MDKKTKVQIINLLKFVFEDQEYNKCTRYLLNNQLNDLRLIISEKYELLSLVSSLNIDDQVLAEQLIKCDELENLVIDVLITTV